MNQYQGKINSYLPYLTSQDRCSRGPFWAASVMGVEDGGKTWTLPTLTVEIRMEKVKHLILDAKGKHATCYVWGKKIPAGKKNELS